MHVEESLTLEALDIMVTGAAVVDSVAERQTVGPTAAHRLQQDEQRAEQERWGVGCGVWVMGTRTW